VSGNGFSVIGFIVGTMRAYMVQPVANSRPTVNYRIIFPPGLGLPFR